MAVNTSESADKEKHMNKAAEGCRYIRDHGHRRQKSLFDIIYLRLKLY